MSWQDRLRPEIKFVSPSGLKFSALWKGDSISSEKRLGRFAYPNIDKEVVQDMGMNSRDVPLTVYFDGSDHDKNARAFEKALYEPDAWQVTHPVYGLLRLQLVSYKLAAEPVESGNVTVVETEWIEPADDEEIDAIPDLFAVVEVAIENVKKTSMLDIIKGAVQKTVSQSKAIANAVRKGINTVNGVIYKADAGINAVQRTINNLANEAYLDIAAISGGVISIMQVPALMYGSMSNKIAMFQNLGDKIKADFTAALDLSEDGNMPENSGASLNNEAQTVQLFLNTITAAMAQSIISEPAETRREALLALNKYRQFTSEAQAALDRAAAMTANVRIENQFVARASSGEAIATLNAAVMRYIMGSMLDLKIERRMVLDRPRAPLDIAITEYKATGENADYYYDFFCRTNYLHGQEWLLLPTGKEVVIYG
jgi:prophage DNA circulation protein